MSRCVFLLLKQRANITHTVFSVRPHTSNTQHHPKQAAGTLRVSTAGDADGFVVDLQADGAGELALDALGRGSRGARAAAGLVVMLLLLLWRLLLLLLAELGARRDKAPKHRHHGAGEDLQLSTTARFPERESCPAAQSVGSWRIIRTAASIHVGRTWWLFDTLAVELSSPK